MFRYDPRSFTRKKKSPNLTEFPTFVPVCVFYVAKRFLITFFYSKEAEPPTWQCEIKCNAGRLETLKGK